MTWHSNDESDDGAERTRSAFQLQELNEAVRIAQEAKVPNKQAFSYAVASLRMREAQYKSEKRYRKALWVRLLVAELAFERSAKRVRGRLMAKLRDD